MNRPLVESRVPIQGQGRALLIAIHAAANSLRLYPFENVTVQKTLDELDRIVSRLTEMDGTAELRLAGDFLFLNEVRLRLDLSNYVASSYLIGVLARHGIGSIVIDPQITRDEWVPFLSLLLRDPIPDDPFGGFVERLERTSVEHLRVGPEREAPPLDAEEDTQSRQAAKRTYIQSVQVAREVLTDSRLGKAVNVRRVKHAVQSMVDQVLNNETSLLGMTTLRDYDEYTFTHSVNVCIFSLVLGQKLGLSKVQLYELGLGALFHDIGKMRISPELTNKAEPLTPAESELMRQHPTEGLLALFSMHGFSEVPFRPMLIAYEHHMKRDMSGYPRSRRHRGQGLFARIVAIADGFDAATSKRSYQALPWQPEDVLSEMRDNPARGFDSLLVKAFINVTGIFPIGTLVILDTYELGVVVAPNPNRALLHQPLIKLISDASGMPVMNPVVVDLSEADPDTGKSLRTIIKTTDPDQYGIRVADYFE